MRSRSKPRTGSATTNSASAFASAISAKAISSSCRFLRLPLDDRHVESARGRFDTLDNVLDIGLRRIPDDGDPLRARQQQLQHFQSLGLQVAGKDRKARQVASGPRKTRHDLLSDRIAGDEHDRNRRRRCLDRANGRCAAGAHDDRRLDVHQFIRQARKLIGPLLSPTEHDLEIASFDIAQVSHAGPERRDILRVGPWRTGVDEPDDVLARCRLGRPRRTMR